MIFRVLFLILGIMAILTGGYTVARAGDTLDPKVALIIGSVMALVGTLQIIVASLIDD